MSLLPPFDNLICGRQRTNRVFVFDYNHEMFLPQHKRKFGYYILPILWVAILRGGIDAILDKSKETQMINLVHADPGELVDKQLEQTMVYKSEVYEDYRGEEGV